MAQDLKLVRAAELAMKVKYGDAESYEGNNQHRLGLPNGKCAVIKTGNKGQVMQRTHGNEIDSRFTGVIDADLVVVAVRDGPNAPITVYEIPGGVYRDRMTSAYADLIQSNQLRPTDLRVLRFDEKGYPCQRVNEEWARYLLTDGLTPPDGSPPPPNRSASLDVAQVIEEAKSMVAEALSVPIDKVSISVNM